MHPLFQQHWSGRRVLLLQGPLGGFFSRLGKWLRAQGAHTQRIAFNGGDWLFEPSAKLFRGSLLQWRAALRQEILEQGYTDIMLFGDCRPVHRVALALARRLGVRAWVFEEGYLRPNWITCEEGGVNAHSPLMAGWPQEHGYVARAEPASKPNRRWTYQAMVLQASAYWLAASLLRWFFRAPHHRSLNALSESLCWLRGYARKLWHAWAERDLMKTLQSERPPFVLLALQVHNDTQIRHHSDYSDVWDFIEESLRSFAEHAPPSMHLVAKHHPMDRAYRDYSRRIRALSKTLGVEHRVHVAHDQHLPTLLNMAKGCLTVNSTVGLQALHHRVPVKTMGRAFYGREELTHQGDLSEFWAWCERTEPPVAAYLRLERYLKSFVLINENFYWPLGTFSAKKKNAKSPADETRLLAPSKR